MFSLYLFLTWLLKSTYLYFLGTCRWSLCTDIDNFIWMSSYWDLELYKLMATIKINRENFTKSSWTFTRFELTFSKFKNSQFKLIGNSLKLIVLNSLGGILRVLMSFLGEERHVSFSKYSVLSIGSKSLKY